MLAGLYLVHYWWYDLVSDTGARDVAGGGLSSWFQQRADDIAIWLNDRGAVPRWSSVRSSWLRSPWWWRIGRVGPTRTFAELLAQLGVAEVSTLRGRFGFMATTVARWRKLLM